MDPRNPDVLFAATHQRQRSYFGMIHGGPGSALWKTMDAGKTWTKVTSGIPMGDLGRIGLNYAPSNPNMIYAMIEATEGRGGLFRSTDDGATWNAAIPRTRRASITPKWWWTPPTPTASMS